MATLQSFLVCVIFAFAAILFPTSTSARLSANFYEKVCPGALTVIKSVVRRAIIREPRMGASLLRLHFHDCFVNGCDGSILLDDTANFIGEKSVLPNLNSLRGFDVVDEIKVAVDKYCKASVVSCADILALAARDSVEILGGSSFFYEVLLGRRDARNASANDVITNLPAPISSFSQLISNFQAHGLDLKDLVVLSGGHSIGLARCFSFHTRIYNDTNIDKSFAASMQQACPIYGGDDYTKPLDATPAKFDTVYYKALLANKGLLHSDQELFKKNDSDSDKLVRYYSYHSRRFAKDFGVSMIKMGNMKPLTGNLGEIRLNCRKVN